MTRRTSPLIKSAVVPMVAAAGVAVGSGLALSTSAEAADCSYGLQTAELPAAKSTDGRIQLAMSHKEKACNPCNPCGATKAGNPCNPCAATNPCNPCAAKNPCNPCAAKNPCNPCAGKKY